LALVVGGQASHILQNTLGVNRVRAEILELGFVARRDEGQGIGAGFRELCFEILERASNVVGMQNPGAAAFDAGLRYISEYPDCTKNDQAQ
jgi:hypothetical protein